MIIIFFISKGEARHKYAPVYNCTGASLYFSAIMHCTVVVAYNNSRLRHFPGLVFLCQQFLEDNIGLNNDRNVCNVKDVLQSVQDAVLSQGVPRDAAVNFGSLRIAYVSKFSAASRGFH